MKGKMHSSEEIIRVLRTSVFCGMPRAVVEGGVGQ